MKTLHLVTDRDRRGAQVHACDLADGLRALGHVADLVALAPGTHGDLLDMPVLGKRKRSFRTIRNLRSMAKGYDVVVAHGSTTLPACAIGLTGSTPFVYRQISDPLFWAATLGRRLRTGLAVRAAAHVVALSDDVGQVFGDHYRLDRSHITTIPNAVPAAAWPRVTTSERTEARRDLGLGDDDFVAVFLGALAPEKGCDLAIEAIGAIEGSQLIVIGDGVDADRLRNLAQSVAPGRVRFTGSLPKPRAALASGDVVVLPSRGGDSMPATLIEAGLCGLPAVSTPVGAIPDVVIDGTTGSVVPIDDVEALTRSIGQLQERDLWTHFSDAARHHCESNFTIEAVAPAWVDVFAQL